MAGYLATAVVCFTLYVLLMVAFIMGMLNPAAPQHAATYSVFVLSCGFAFANGLACVAAACFKHWWRHAGA